ncbi:major facilitator superfamily transporter [Xylariaceae sp. FL0662B]|nr:major facilitator superfamily transporter [Xylariaceae sp. FL0662B]
MAAGTTEPSLSQSDPSQSDSSTQTGAALTPQSDSNSDDGEDLNHPSLEVSDLPFDNDSDEAFELQDRSRQNVARHADEAYSDDEASSRARRPSDSTIASFQFYTPDEERAVVRKFDRRLVLFLSLCYMLSFLDRSNIGNARIAGMEEDLQTRPPRDDFYEWALTSFYITYVTFEWMSLLWKLIPAHIYVSCIVFSWGVLASLQSVATSYPVLIFLRTLLGIGEAAFTGVPFYLSFFFKRDELAFRTAIFISAAPLATAFASSLAWVILKLGENGPIAPWRLLFLLEGFPSVVVAIIAWSVIPDSPDAASYLTSRQKEVARLRLRHEKPRRKGLAGSTTRNPPSGGLKAKAVLSAFVDAKAWITAVMFFLANMAYSSLPVFLPTILKEMGHTALESQALTAVPFLVAFATVLATAYASDRARARAPFVAALALASAAGYAALALARPLGLGPRPRYLAIYPAAAGFFAVVVLVIAWSVNNQRSDAARGGAFALLQLVGQCGPLVGTRLYPKRHAPFYVPGMAACAAAMLAVAMLALLLRFLLARENRRLDDDNGARGAAGEVVEEEARGLVGSRSGSARGSGGWGDEASPRGFRYML